MQFWINVESENGMFSSEKAVTITLKNGQTVTLFANTGLLRHEGGRDLLSVILIKQNSDSNLVLLPSETFETSSRYVEIPAH